MSADYNIPSLDQRKICNYRKAMRPCASQVPNPFKGVGAFLGRATIRPTRSVLQMTQPFPVQRRTDPTWPQRFVDPVQPL
jgi:hypothetical protein